MKRSLALVALALLAHACAPGSPSETTARVPKTGKPDAAEKGDAPSDEVAASSSTDLYFQTFGKPEDQPIVFLHGGPGANSVGFETAAAPDLAARGFFVVTYDQRGGGRSPKGTASDYSYARSTKDLDDLIHALKLKSPILLPNSFGGSVALKYVDAHPSDVRAVILVDASMNNPQTYLTITINAEDVYDGRFRSDKVTEMRELRAKMFPHGLTPPFDYTAKDVGQIIDAMNSARLMYPDTLPDMEAVQIYAKIGVLSIGSDLAEVNPAVGDGYQTNDKAGYTDFMPLLAKHKARVWALYGAEDKIFDDAQKAAVAAAIAPHSVKIIEAASHFPFVDRKTEFIEAVVSQVAEMK